MPSHMSALTKTRVLDLSDDKSIYGVKMLADLGACVVRPESPEGDPLRKRGPFDNESGESLWYAYYGSSRRTTVINPDQSEALNRLLVNADICFLGRENPLCELLDVDGALLENKSLVVVDCSPFGDVGPWRDFKAPDLVAGALGGSAGVTGDENSPPLKLFGDLNFTISGAYAAVAGLAGLRHAREFGEGQRIVVPVHECIASTLEHVFMWYYYHDNFPNARAKALERRGSLHWTNLYVVMPTQNGSMMVTPTPNVDNQLAWLIEEDAFQDLLEPKYQEPGARGLYFPRLMQVLREWVATEDSEELFYKAQDHHAPYGWVHTIDQVAGNPQLAARDWWQSIELGTRTVSSPGVPCKFEKTPAQVSKPVALAVEADQVASSLGWED